jgi:hypothetical protein
MVLETLRVLLAPVMNAEPGDLDRIVIITRGKCRDCGERDNTGILDTDKAGTEEGFLGLLADAAMVREFGKDY